MVQDSRVAVIGGGIAGLVAACELSKSGARVTLFERRPHLGGLASSFEIEQGHHIEKYYHFICRPDKAYLEMLAELGLSSRVHWVTTKMGLFYNGSLYSLGDPITLFAFPHLSILDKIRFGWSTAVSKLRGSKDWKNLENIPASDWLIRRYGRRTYEILYKPLLDLKFRERAPKISAAWMWGRFHRLGNSRTVTQKERVGYVDGGTQAYVDALVKRIRAGGGDIRT
ncbi:FAD-dependent oxidoreductase, partial [Candidatus Sumerlaeota bacterium]|nr:FAD-dependent oxidoreductase [Candidatus Sumerlaeota bacterium]